MFSEDGCEYTETGKDKGLKGGGVRVEEENGIVNDDGEF